MKRLFFMLLALPFCIDGYAQSKEERAVAMADAMDYAKSIAFTYMDVAAAFPRLSADSMAYLSYTGGAEGGRMGADAMIKQHDPGPKWMGGGTKYVYFEHSNKMVGRLGEALNYFAMIPGRYALKVPRNGSTAEKTKKGISIELDSLEFTFEAGKFYTIHNMITPDLKVEFSIEETDREAYQAFQRANPDHLAGTWTVIGNGRRSWTNRSLKDAVKDRFMQYTIEGDRMKFETKLGKREFTAEGCIIYNENSIIFFPQRAMLNGNEVKDFSTHAPYMWYYTLTDGVLRLDGAKRIIFGAHLLAPRPFMVSKTRGEDSEGEFQKTN